VHVPSYSFLNLAWSFDLGPDADHLVRRALGTNDPQIIAEAGRQLEAGIDPSEGGAAFRIAADLKRDRASSRERVSGNEGCQDDRG
jgi:hypothetical protein